VSVYSFVLCVKHKYYIKKRQPYVPVYVKNPNTRHFACLCLKHVHYKKYLRIALLSKDVLSNVSTLSLNAACNTHQKYTFLCTKNTLVLPHWRPILIHRRRSTGIRGINILFCIRCCEPPKFLVVFKVIRRGGLARIEVKCSVPEG
jgi:hypothetical protein